MGQDIYARVVAGAEFHHENKRKDSVVTRYHRDTGLPYEEKVYEWYHLVHGKEYTKEEYKEFRYSLEGVELFYADCGQEPVIIGIVMDGDYDMVMPIDLEKAKELIEQAKVSLAPYGYKPEDVKLYSIAVNSY